MLIRFWIVKASAQVRDQLHFFFLSSLLCTVTPLSGHPKELVSDSLSPRQCSTRNLDRDGVQTHASRWSKHSQQKKFYSKYLRMNLQWCVFAATCKKSPKHPNVFHVLTKKPLSDHFSAHSSSQVHMVSKNRENRIPHP